ncbi:MAG: ATP-binding cassette domain-containing protein [Planctomycetota bacterium]|nr:ATP-binding cassette domain-containing protein [Planctomycetota bacterium]
MIDPPIISAKELSRHYRVAEKSPGLMGSLRALWGGRNRVIVAVDNVSFSIQPGEIVGFLGPNGAGKTTTLKMLSGLIYPSSGTAEVLGYVPWERADPFRRQFALVMGQKNQLWWDLPASDSFELHREIYSLPKDRFRRVMGELVELFGVAKLLRQPVRELSLGERMKMELIACLLHEPRVLMLDEPTIGLDVVAQQTIQRCLREYNQSKKATILLTSHYMRDVEALCQRVLVITNGKLVHDGPLAGIVQRFGAYKQVRLQFAGEAIPPGLRLPDSATVMGSVVDLSVSRDMVSETISGILEQFPVTDLTVSDPPLEEVVARYFQESASGAGA